MKFEDKLKACSSAEIWSEYLGFLDLDMAGYMSIQNRLMAEQISMWSKSPLGKTILNGRDAPQTIDEFRQTVPLTDYSHYADILLQKRGDMLPDTPVIWIQTTWEGGRHPIKVAPYTKGMLDTYRSNIIACLILSTSTKRGQFDVKATDRILYALAPLPYATGLFPLALGEEIGIEFLPPVQQAVNMTFSERNKAGFKMGVKGGIDFFFGLGSVAYYVSKGVASLASSNSGGSAQASGLSAKSLMRLARAKSRSNREKRDLQPKDLFRLKGFMCAGTDNECYKDDLEELWGVRPMELFAGTEPTCIGTETWTRNGMYFFPDACFYEFIPESDMRKSMKDPKYRPVTVLMNQVIPGEKYELAISVFKGGAFMRYRMGDVYRCEGTVNAEDSTKIPRFRYVDRIPGIIDIGGFTRISENSIASVVELSGLPVEDWVALKRHSQSGRPYMHMYVEMKAGSLSNSAVSTGILKQQLSIYFRHLDNDYKDLQRILGIEPLEITIIRCGSFEEYRMRNPDGIDRMNPPPHQLDALLKC